MPTTTPQQREGSVSSLVDELVQSAPGAGGAGGGKGSDSRPDWRKVRLIALGLVGMIGAIFIALPFIGDRAPSAGSESRIRVMMDAETGEVFERYRIREGDTGPWKNPSTGRDTLYQPERCYWTEDGKATAEPTYVLLSEMIGKPGKTVCPDCGREVIPHNPLPPQELVLEAIEAEDGR